MNSTPPRASSEYSRGPARSWRPLLSRRRQDSAGRRGGFAGAPERLRTAILVIALLGSLLLVMAEFTPLFHVHVATSLAPVKSVDTGSHHAYALVPIALLAGALAFAVFRGAGPPALIALGALGILTLLIALIGDLPDARASGLVGSAARGYSLGTASPSTGLYLETLGAFLLVVTSGIGLLLLGTGPGKATGGSGVP
jgi:hypothetical protein